MRVGRSRRAVTLIAVLALAGVAGCSAASDGDLGVTGSAASTAQVPASTAGSGSPSAPGAVAVAGSSVQRQDLERAGITVVADDYAAVASNSFTVSAVQLERMLTEQSLGGGVLGRDLDTIAPMPDSLPSTSYLVQAWLAKGTSAAAESGRAAMGDAARATTGIADIVYPTVVVALFVADLGQMIAEATEAAALGGGTGDARGSAGSGTAAPSSLRGEAAALSASAPCTAANDFIAQTINGVFDLLKLDIPSGGGFFELILGTFAGIWNYALGLAKGVINAVVGTITEAIFAKIRIVAAGLGAASILMSYLKGQQLVVTVEPQFTKVASGTEPDIPGRYIARAHPLSDLWPPALMDCITVAGGKMPELMLPGAQTRWQMVEAVARPGLVVPATLTTTVAADHRAYLDFVTGREPAEWATGAEMLDGPFITVDVEQKGITDFLRETKDSLLADLKGSILSLIPVAQVKSVLMSVIGAVLDPIANRIEAELNSSVGGMFTLKGVAEPVMVTYHREPDEPAAAPQAEPADPFCDKIRDLVTWGNAHQAAPLEQFSTEILGRLIAARAVAPAPMRGPVDAGIPVYEAGQSGSAMAFAMVGLDGMKAWGNAAPQILAYCKISAQGWPQSPDG